MYSKEERHQQYLAHKEQQIARQRDLRRIRVKESKEKYGIGGRTIRRYGLKLALEIYDKFDRKCNECNSENELTIHHLDHNGTNLEMKGLKPNNDINNLIILCQKCHGKLHANKRWESIPRVTNEKRKERMKEYSRKYYQEHKNVTN